jgi:hypothetical protein
MSAMATEPEAAYPVRVEIPYPERQSHWLGLVKWLLAIPHIIIMRILTVYVAFVTVLIAFFAILFTGQYPAGIFKFNVGIRRWQLNVSTYLWLLRDEYPPFSFDPGQYPAALDVDYPDRLNRWLVLVKWLLLIPHYIVLFFLSVAAAVVWIIVLFAQLFTGRAPEGLFRFLAGRLRWNERVTLYLYLVTDKYPPFSLD